MAADLLSDAMCRAMHYVFAPYLRRVLQQAPPESHAQVEGQFTKHMDFLTDYCLRSYLGAGGLTVEFIKGLHRAMFPPNYRQEITTREGYTIWMVPGEFKTVSNNVVDSYLHPGKVNVFLPAEQVPTELAHCVGELNIALSLATDPDQIRNAILRFVIQFLSIHPFVDANGRVAFILADLLALRAGLPAFYLTAIKSADTAGFTRAIERACELRNLAPLREFLAMESKESGSFILLE